MVGTSTGHSNEFPATWWTLIDRAQSNSTTTRTIALGQIVLRYLSAMRAHLILRRRLPADVADELLQGFVTEKILSQYLVRHADRTKGKFRSLLIRSLENFYWDWVRQNRSSQMSQPTVSLEDAAVAVSDEADVFDVAWARQLLDEVINVMRADCLSHNQEYIWGVFECRLLSPARNTAPPVSYECLCERFGFASPEQASNALVTAKRKFQKVFARVAARYQRPDEQVEDTLRDLIKILSRTGPTDWRRIREAAAAGVPGHHDGLDDSRPLVFARLMELAPDTNALWQPDDLAALLRHQLALRLKDLALDIRTERKQGLQASSAKSRLMTLGDLFRHPHPPLELLAAVKQYVRTHVHGGQGALPDEIGSALYYASTAAALVRHNLRMTAGDDVLLRYGFEQMVESKWVESPLRELFEAGLTRLDLPA